MERPVHDSIGALVILAAVVLLLAACGAPMAPDVQTCWVNHSGVEECPASTPTMWRPTDTTGGADIIL